MKRYRGLVMDFDSRSTLLSMEIEENWDEKIKEQHSKNKENIKQELVNEFGLKQASIKIKNFVDLGPKPMSILAFHNKFLEQIRRAFIIGSSYPALVSACSLGERILNHMIHTLRDDFKNTFSYKKVFNRDSFDDWEQAISILDSWGILLPEVSQEFRALAKIRHRSVHFNPIVDTNDRPLALDAIEKLTNIIRLQFGAFGTQPWFIPKIPGASFIKKEYESKPFIRRIYLPNCVLIGPNHKIEIVEGQFFAVDNEKYIESEISDEEYCKLLKRKE